MSRYHRVVGSRVLDIGGGPGYLAEAFMAAGAQCIVVEYSLSELHLFERQPTGAVVGDGQSLPIATGSVDVVVSSNVLEHVPAPTRVFEEAARVLRPGGMAFMTFTNWFSPWGGHETSPWHLLGGRWALRRFERAHGGPTKHRYGETLFRIDVGPTIRWARRQKGFELVDCFPRYWPGWMRWVVSVPALREVATWNLVLVMRSTGRWLPAPPRAGRRSAASSA